MASLAAIGQDRNDAPQWFTNRVRVDGALSTTGGTTVPVGNSTFSGTATLNGVTAVTIVAPALTATSRIFLGFVTPAGTPGAPYVSAVTPGTGFQVKSSASDTSVIAWSIVKTA